MSKTHRSLSSLSLAFTLCLALLGSWGEVASAQGGPAEAPTPPPAPACPAPGPVTCAVAQDQVAKAAAALNGGSTPAKTNAYNDAVKRQKLVCDRPAAPCPVRKFKAVLEAGSLKSVGTLMGNLAVQACGEQCQFEVPPGEKTPVFGCKTPCVYSLPNPGGAGTIRIAASDACPAAANVTALVTLEGAKTPEKVAVALAKENLSPDKKSKFCLYQFAGTLNVPVHFEKKQP
jgi:hypothetical protein